MAKIKTMSLNVIKKLAQQELSKTIKAQTVNIIALNVLDVDDDQELNDLFVIASLYECADEKYNGTHKWILEWDSDEDEFVTVMCFDQEKEKENEKVNKLFYDDDDNDDNDDDDDDDDYTVHVVEVYSKGDNEYDYDIIETFKGPDAEEEAIEFADEYVDGKCIRNPDLYEAYDLADDEVQIEVYDETNEETKYVAGVIKKA